MVKLVKNPEIREKECQAPPHYCRNCLRRMDVKGCGKGDFKYSKGTLDCPAQISIDPAYTDEILAIEAVGCCSFDDGSMVKTVDDCRYRDGCNNWSECTCHNTMIIYGTCLSKRNHGACPYGLKGSR